jgi:hypothetical protein
MKKIFFSFALIIKCACLLFAQQYHPFLNTTSWYQVTSMLGQSYNWIYVSHDTLINNITYKVILVDGGVTSSWFVREDVAQKKVYTPAGVLYDFNLQAGSQFNISSITFNVISVDSVLTNAGYRKRFQLKYNNITVQIIEGVGSIEHPFRITNFGIDPVYRLACNYEGHQNIYNRQGETCPVNIFTSAIDKNIESHFDNVYPNPISDMGQINTHKKRNSISKIEFRDIQGKKVIVNYELNDDFLLLKKDNSNNGVYFYFIQDKNGEISKGKFIFQ